ncbi:hypothetical protein [Mesorhizobium sp. B2-8-5]|uniref:hypothetical protein n=1 Tax=Mesorhizobium sp. B2-8-5 TaxID=2589903 RepID=UPI00112D5FE5|nr:hypothetical protein [Mesorhizobium sp. B2-8-5]UCI28428.1 hypothetical protein FJ430_12895 [Mesorhizobium sp. B2-8-5]
MDSSKALVSAKLALSPTNKVGKTLGLTVRAGEAKIGWHFPTIRYAVSRIVLHFHTEDCSLPEEDWAFDAITLGDIEVAHEISETTETNKGVDNEWTASISASAPSGGVKSSRSGSIKKTGVKTSRFSTTNKSILAHGNEVKPAWSLTSELGQRPLLGTLIKHDRFCRAEPNGPKPKVSVSFEIPYDALLFKRMDGSFSSGNKFGIIRLLLRASICERNQPLCETDL